MMDCQAISTFYACLIIIREVATDDTSEEISYQFDRNSTYAERRWNITLGSSFIEDKHIEDCQLLEAAKHSTWWSKGPLCKICSQAIARKFPPEEPIKLRYAAFLHGILTFPNTEDEILIDVILCSYDPEVGIDRFYLTRAKEENSVYSLKTVGSKHDKYKFILDSYYRNLEADRTDE